MEKKTYIKPEIKKIEIKATNAVNNSYGTPFVPAGRNAPLPTPNIYDPYYDPYVDPSQE